MNSRVMLSSGKGDELTFEVNNNVSIVLPRDVYSELIGYTTLASGEISGCGLVEKVVVEKEVSKWKKEKEVELVVKEIFLPTKQKNTNGGTEFDSEEVAKIITKLVEENKNPELLKLHWHSHASMNVFHSATDEDNYATLDNGEYLVSLVTNKNGHILGRVDFFLPFHTALINVPVYVDIGSSDVENKILVNMEKMKEESTKVGFGMWIENRYMPGQFSYDVGYGSSKYSKILEDAKREKKIREKVRRKLNLSIYEIDRFENCHPDNYSCMVCSDAKKCKEYKDEFSKRLSGQEKPVGGSKPIVVLNKNVSQVSEYHQEDWRDNDYID